MSESNRSRQAELLGQLRFVLNEPVDFTRTGSESTPGKVRLLAAAATCFNILTVSEHGGRLGPIREPGLVEQVIAAAFQTFADIEPHPTAFDKAAMLLRGITQGHPFQDGNKRTGFLTANYYLARVGYELRRDLDKSEVITFCRRISAGEIRDIDEMARTLAIWSVPRRDDSRQ